MPYDYKPFAYRSAPGLTAPEPRHPVVIVGAGPIGVAAALDLAQYGIASVVLDDNDVVSVGSRAICWSKRSLEILDRLGLGDKAVAKGVTWKVGRTYHRDAEVFNFDLLPEDGHKMPAFINLQQYYVEQFLVDAALTKGLIDIRFKNRVVGISQSDCAMVEVETPEGRYSLDAEYVLACDGAKSPIRTMMGLDFEGELFEEKFLIADIEMDRDFPSERRFWFEPEFHEGQSALLHKQPDNIYRIDLQLGWDADSEVEAQPDRIIPRIEKVVDHSDFTLDWTSIYTFQCRRMAQFVHNRVIFVGDSAHIVSPFGARGGNGGLQDVDALGWRLAAVVQGNATPEALQHYDVERQFGADENIANSARATKFMSPDAGAERWFRDATLSLASKAAFARPLVNSGRLSVPSVYPLSAPDDPALPALSRPGSVAPDLPLRDGWLLNRLGGRVVLLCVDCAPPAGCEIETVEITGDDTDSAMMERRYGATGHYLIRPDQVVAARWRGVDGVDLGAAVSALWEGPS